MDSEIRRQILDIMINTKCEHNFRCIEKNFEEVCKARDFGMENYVDCLEEDADLCNFSVAFGDGFLCSCPVRVFASKKLNI